jgi:hypothetical protein
MPFNQGQSPFSMTFNEPGTLSGERRIRQDLRDAE